MDLEKLKLRLGIDSNDTGFDNELNAWIEDAETELCVYIGTSSLEAADKLLPSYGLFVRNYVLLQYKGDNMTITATEYANSAVENSKENFYVERYNRLNK